MNNYQLISILDSHVIEDFLLIFFILEITSVTIMFYFRIIFRIGYIELTFTIISTQLKTKSYQSDDGICKRMFYNSFFIFIKL